MSPGKAAVEKTGGLFQKTPVKSLPGKLQTRPTASKRVQPRHMTPYNLNKDDIKTYIKN